MTRHPTLRGRARILFGGLLLALAPLAATSRPPDATPPLILFPSSTADGGRERSATDLTQRGSRMIRDVCPGGCDSWPEYFFVLRPAQDDSAGSGQGSQAAGNGDED